MVYISKKTLGKVPYLLSILIIIFIIKPVILFKQNGKIREYGVGKDSDGYKKTLYTFHFIIILLILILKYILD